MSDFQGWIASLSNGEHILEIPTAPGGSTPWRILLERLKKESLQVTGMILVRNNIKVVSLPKKQCDGYFQAYELHMRAINHEEFRQQGIGSIVGDKIFITWVILGDNPSNASVFQEVRSLESSREHTTLN